MKKNRIGHLVAGLLLLLPSVASAQQTLRSGYFLEGFEQRHFMNPAYGPDRKGYVSFPFLGNLNVGLSGNVGVSNFLYQLPDGSGLTTFMNECVSTGEFLGGLKDNNRLGAEVNMGIFSMGFSKFGGYNTIGLNLRTHVNAVLPYELFEFMKVGGKGDLTEYHMENIGVSSKAYLELSLGHSRDINKQWRVGGKFKMLFGAANASAFIDRMDVSLSGDQWRIEGSGDLNVAVKGLSLPSNAESLPPTEYESEKAQTINFDDVDFDSPGLTGFGLAIDLGATYKFRDDLEFSAALLDIGFMSWGNNTHGVLSSTPWTFNGFQNVPYDSDDDNGIEKPNSIENQMDQLTDDLKDYFSFQKESDGGRHATALGATLNLSALYTLPYYDKLKFGFLSSTRIQGKYSWSEGRFSANVAPVKWFDASINYAVSSFGSSFGWLINFHPHKFNFFIGSDHQFFKITPQFLPVHKANMNLAMGINFNL